MTALTVESLTKSFGAKLALDDVTFTAEEGQLLTLLGPSGCGKSTTLWSIAGLHQPDHGRITFGGDPVFDAGRGVNLPAERRECGVVFQSYAIWPHMSVHDNVAYPLKLRKVPKRERAARVAEVLALVELDGLAGRYPHQLSGGQQQRVSLARALAYQPRVLLLDEPFSNLDAKLRDRARAWLRDLQQRVGITTVFVTHDQDEALSMSDRVVVMHDGAVAQIGVPEDVYHRPVDLFVADFVGSVNLIPGDVVSVSDGVAEFVIAGTQTAVRVAADASVRPGPADLGVRPEALTLAAGDTTGPTISAERVGRRFLGDHYRHLVRCGDAEFAVQNAVPEIPERPLLQLGEHQLYPRNPS
ncbi:MAG TPA: ABC transporter ATP-binding protein [Ilumatobacter sp.]|nr:ABC transporter ATP-binding protein [Ilumatobacter sp.]